MQRTNLSLYYLISYLVFAGVALIAAPQFALKLLLSTGEYGDVLPRLLGIIVLALGLVVVQIVRLKVETLYSTTIMVRGVILAGLCGLYIYAHDPFFLVLIGIVGLGVILTGTSYWLDRSARGQDFPRRFCRKPSSI